MISDIDNKTFFLFVIFMKQLILKIRVQFQRFVRRHYENNFIQKKSINIDKTKKNSLFFPILKTSYIRGFFLIIILIYIGRMFYV